MIDDFKKRIYDLGSFFHDVIYLARNIPGVIDALCCRRVSKSFRAKLNMAVISVLGCRYCSWLHSEIALAQGVEGKELKSLLSQEIGDFPEEEAIALAFAQHYSETGGTPHKEAEKSFYEYYDKKLAENIVIYIRIIYLGNLSGNTIDAFFNRLKGQPVDGSRLWAELVIFALLGPYYLVILPLIAHILQSKNRGKADEVID